MEDYLNKFSAIRIFRHSYIRQMLTTSSISMYVSKLPRNLVSRLNMNSDKNAVITKSRKVHQNLTYRKMS